MRKAGAGGQSKLLLDRSACRKNGQTTRIVARWAAAARCDQGLAEGGMTMLIAMHEMGL
jgi:hypothetical protein